MKAKMLYCMAKREGTQKSCVLLNYGTLNVNEIKLVDITKIMISLRKAKPE